MFDIAVVSCESSDAPAEFARSLRDTGFAVLTDHPITPERIDSTYETWAEFFGSDDKMNWVPDEGHQDGYFPFRSENAKDSAVKDLKEFYHVYPNGKLPEPLADVTWGLHADLVALGQRLLGWVQDNTPDDIRDSFSEPLPDMLQNSHMNLLRVLHYPALEEAPEPGAVRAAAHGDINLITLLVAGTESGLEAKDTSGNWHRVPCDPGMMAVNVGDMLQMASGGYYPSTIHRVVNPPADRNVARYSMPMFLHPRPEVLLAPNTTADDYLNQRLREIGLK